MSPALQQAIPQWHAILKMDTNPARFKWMRRNGEPFFAAYRRRRAWLMAAGVGSYLCNREWDELTPAVRAKLGGAA